MSTIASLRMRGLAERLISDSPDFAPDEKAVERITKKAYDDLIDLVTRMPDRKHYHDVVLGGQSMSSAKIKAWIEAATKQLAVIDPDSGIRVERYSFSNVGDPYYMGPDEMRTQNGIRFIA